MPRIRICTVCGAEFTSRNGKEVCSESCGLERKKEQNRKGNKRRYAKESNTPFDRVCPICGRKFESVRSIYYPEECAKIARKRQVKENSDEYYKEHREEILKKRRDEKWAG